MGTDKALAVPRHLLFQAAAGVAYGAGMALLMLGTDTGGLLTLARASDATAAPLFILGGALVFAPVFVATAVGLLGRADAGPTGDA